MPQVLVRSVFQQAYDLLRARVIRLRNEGVQKLPSEPQLAAELAVSRDTIRRVLSELARERLVDRQTGRGSFIRPASKRKTISFLVPGEPSERFAPCAATIMYGASLDVKTAAEKIHFLGLPESSCPGIADRLIREARSLRCDGYIAGLPLRFEDCRKVLDAHIPLVVTYNDFASEAVPAFLIDH